MSHFLILRDASIKANAIALINSLNPGRTYCIEIKEYRKNRSNAQNRLYWMWINLLAKDIGYEAEDLHETFKARLLGTEEKLVFGQSTLIAKSTTKLTTEEFTHYLEKIEQLALTMGMRLPHPQEYQYAMGTEQPAQNDASSTAGYGVPEGVLARAASSGRH